MSYDELSAEAKDLNPGSDGLVFVPHFGGRVTPNDPYVRGSWIGLKFTHKRAHLWRAIMEGIAYEYRYYQEVAKKRYPEHEHRCDVCDRRRRKKPVVPVHQKRRTGDACS